MHKLLFFLSLLFFGTFQASEQIGETHFEVAQQCEREYLIAFAVESNDIYQTRKASIDVARMVFDIPEDVIEKGLVEVLKIENEIVGFYALKEAELTHLFVKAGLQRKGYGTALFHRVIEVAKSKEWKRIEWLCDPDAKGFYLKMGATIFDTCENLLDPDVDLPIFEYYL